MGASPVPKTAAVSPGAPVRPPEKLFTRPARDIPDDPPPTVKVTTTFTACGTAFIEAIVTAAVYAPGDKFAEAESVRVPAPLPDCGDTVSQLAA